MGASSGSLVSFHTSSLVFVIGSSLVCSLVFARSIAWNKVDRLMWIWLDRGVQWIVGLVCVVW